MKNLNLLIAFLLMVTCVNAQDKIAQKYASTITEEDAFSILSVLASDEFEGRGTGQPGAEKAAQYIKSKFETYGLTAPVNNSYFQQLDLKEITPKERKITVNGKPQTFLKDFYASPSFFQDIKKNYQDFVFVGYGIKSEVYDDLSGLNLEGKVAVILEGEPMINGISLITGKASPSKWSTQRNNKIAAIAKMNPLAILVLDANLHQMKVNIEPYSRRSLVLGEAKPSTSPMTIRVSERFLNTLLKSSKNNVSQLRNKIASTKLPASFKFKAQLDIEFTVNKKQLDAKNVLGFLEGTDPELKNEVLVITAHYDHLGINAKGEIFNGADDDGSGTTGILELAEAFTNAKQEGNGPKRSILFMTVVGEEKGLLGSEWYADYPVFPLKNTIANLNIDMIGRVGELYKGRADSANYIYVVGSDKLSTSLKQVSESVNKTYNNLTLDYKYDDPKDPMRIYYRSDHYNFAKNNIPIIFYFNGIHEDYHKKTDDIEKINFPLLVKRTQLVFYTAWELANRAEKPVVDQTDNTQN